MNLPSFKKLSFKMKKRKSMFHYEPDPLLYYKMIILRYHEIFFRLTAPRCPGMADDAVSLRKSHDIVILSFCNILKGQTICLNRDTCLKNVGP